MLDTEHTSHTTYRIAYHFCYIPKYRKMVLRHGIDNVLWQLHEQIAAHYDMKILEQEVLPDMSMDRSSELQKVRTFLVEGSLLRLA